jgi:hypothetical protein
MDSDYLQLVSGILEKDGRERTDSIFSLSGLAGGRDRSDTMFSVRERADSFLLPGVTRDRSDSLTFLRDRADSFSWII